MPVGDICRREVVVANRDMTIDAAAKLMRHHHVGDLVILAERRGRKVPIGIVTDRDIVVSVLAVKVDPSVFTVGDLISRDIVTAEENLGILEAIQYMRMNGVRRLPIVDHDGELVGILSVDDVIRLLAEEMGELATLISRELVQETQVKR